MNTSRYAWSVALLVAVNLQHPLSLAAQRTCQEHLRAFPWRASSARTAGVYDLGSAMDSALGVEVAARRPFQGGAGLPRDTIYTLSRTSVLWFKASRDTIAYALAWIMEGERAGFGSDLAVTASDVYRIWEMPIQAALDLLADPSVSPAAKARAVNALRGGWSADGFAAAATAALCALAARASGVQGMIGTRGLPLQNLLDDEEWSLLDAMEWALAHGPSSTAVNKLLAALPASNPVTRHVRGYLKN